MANEEHQQEQQKQQPASVEDQNQVQAEPANLGEAFTMLRQNQQAPAQEPVEDQGTEEADSTATVPVERAETATGDGSVQPDLGGIVGSSEQNVDNAGVGGSSNDIEGFDSNAYTRGLAQQIQEQAMAEANELFQKNNIKLFSINDLYERNDNTGEVTFKNPDNPNRPFQSRSEAQQWVNSMNDEINAQFKREVMKNRNRLAQQVEPTVKMVNFIPKYNAMDETTRDIFDDLVAPYQIVSNGEVTGYSCDLDAVLAQATKFAKKFGQPVTTAAQPADNQQASQPATTPALDMNAQGSSSTDTAGTKEPTTLGEALKMYQEQNRKGK